MLAFECDPAVYGRVWAIRAAPSATADAAAADAVGSSATTTTPSANAESWAVCSGELRVDLESGQAEEGLFQFTIGLTMIGLGHVDSNGSVQSAIGLG
jgi:hypothetical protein